MARLMAPRLPRLNGAQHKAVVVTVAVILVAACMSFGAAVLLVVVTGNERRDTFCKYAAAEKFFDRDDAIGDYLRVPPPLRATLVISEITVHPRAELRGHLAPGGRYSNTRLPTYCSQRFDRMPTVEAIDSGDYHPG